MQIGNENEMIPVDGKWRGEIDRLIEREWAGPMVATNGVLHDTSQAEGFVFLSSGQLAGYLLYCLENGECEVLVLHSLAENQGVGSALLGLAAQKAREIGCGRLWLVTTNDNVRAIRFYQRFGMELKAVRIGAMDQARASLKPSIPPVGMDGIPIRHEFEFEMLL